MEDASVAERAQRELRDVLRIDPRDAEAMMKLGLLMESQGARVGAEELLKRAASVDRTFKPAWTLANFYFRNNQENEMWPEIRKVLEITTKPNLLFFDVAVVYDLCWKTGVDAKRILALVPERPAAMLSYFYYLVSQRHLDAAMEAYPKALPYADPSVQLNRDTFVSYCIQLAQGNRPKEAVEVWNQSVAKQLVKSMPIDPGKADSIANPSFSLPFEPAPFGWAGKTTDNVALTYTPGSVLLEFSGRQAEILQILEKTFPVLAEQSYVLTWDAEANGVMKPSDLRESGLKLRLYADTQQIPIVCDPFLSADKGRACRFYVSAGKQEPLRLLRMTLSCERPAGSVRLRGALRISRFHLAFAS